MYIKIAGVHFGIYTEDKHLKKRLRSFFADYIVRKKPGYFIIIRGGIKDLIPPLSFGIPVVVAKNKEHYEIIKKLDRSDLQVAIISKDLTECAFDLEAGFSYSDVISVIRAYVHFIIEKQGGFLLHASCGTLNGRAYVFTGRHNAGKSTALKNLRPDRRIAEDCLAVKVCGNKPEVFSTPFRKEASSAGTAGAVIFPRKTKRKPCVIRENISRAVAEVVSNTMFSSPENIEIINIVMDSIFRFCSVVPAFTLYSAKTSNIREIVLLNRNFKIFDSMIRGGGEKELHSPDWSDNEGSRAPREALAPMEISCARRMINL